jgi:hypothetical protein
MTKSLSQGSVSFMRQNNMVMARRARNQEWLRWRRPAAIYPKQKPKPIMNNEFSDM